MPASSCCLSFYAPALREHVQGRHAGIGVDHDQYLLRTADELDQERLRVPELVLLEDALRQPHGLVFKTHVQPDGLVRLIDDNLVLGGIHNNFLRGDSIA